MFSFVHFCLLGLDEPFLFVPPRRIEFTVPVLFTPS